MSGPGFLDSSAPHPRGWSHHRRRHVRRLLVGPAPAGMVPRPGRRTRAAARRPRTRGDGPTTDAGTSGGYSSAPHPRGWSRDPVVGRGQRLVGPAPAGMVPDPHGQRRRSVRRPRTRGDGPAGSEAAAKGIKSAPHPRGWSRGGRGGGRGDGVGPAPAGMVPQLARHPPRAGVGPAPAGMVPPRPHRVRRRHRRPRTRGDGPIVAMAEEAGAKSAPHPRGWSQAPAGARGRPGVGPAPAGMVRWSGGSPTRTCGRPRTRGDGPAHGLVLSSLAWSAPHPRGWSAGAGPRGHGAAVGPAPAGMVRRVLRAPHRRPGRPRTRGDGPWGRTTLTTQRWSAPHPRGWSLEAAREGQEQDVGPAPAGMVPRRPCPPARGRGRPRTRGDGPGDTDEEDDRKRSAPHPRGWSPVERTSPVGRRVGPAPAGMVRSARRTRRARTDRPRTRGDGPATTRSPSSVFPSAPHPRGWSTRDRDPDAVHPAGPAPAGMVRTTWRPGPARWCRPCTGGDGP